MFHYYIRLQAPSREVGAQHKATILDLMTTEWIEVNQHWCDWCMNFFSSRHNLTRHQNQCVHPCHFNDNTTTPRKVVNVLTSKLRYRTPVEQCELAHVQKMKRYW